MQKRRGTPTADDLIGVPSADDLIGDITPLTPQDEWSDLL